MCQTISVRGAKELTINQMVSVRVKQCRELAFVRDQTYSAGVQTMPGGTLSLLAIKVQIGYRLDSVYSIHAFSLGSRKEREKELEKQTAMRAIDIGREC